MTRSLKRKPKGLVIEELLQLVERGHSLHQAPVEDFYGLASLSIDRLEWALAVLQLLPQMTKGIQVVADFNRAGTRSTHVAGESLEQGRAAFQQDVGGQVDVLAKAVDRWSKSGTRPLQ
jgi:hypothetical protein